MTSAFILPQYFIWHYGVAYGQALHIWKNLLWFLFNFFSIKLLLKTFFDPWERLNEEYKKGFDVGELASTFIVNILMRIVGMLVRLVVILVGLVVVVLHFILGFLFLALWTVLPVVFLGLVVSALSVFIL